MADSSLIGVIIGGLIGIAGSVIGPLVLEWRKQVADKKKRQAEKLEELTSALYEHEYWTYNLPKNIQLGKDDFITALSKLSPPPISKMLAISHIYFPELQEQVHEFSRKSAAYINSVITEGKVDRSNPFFVQQNEATKHFEDIIRDYAKREFR